MKDCSSCGQRLTNKGIGILCPECDCKNFRCPDCRKLEKDFSCKNCGFQYL